MNYIESLIASGVRLGSLELFSSQQERTDLERRKQRAEFQQRIAKATGGALAAAVIEPPPPEEDGPQANDEGFSEWEKNLALELQAAMTEFVEGDTSAEAWVALLTDVLGPPFHSAVEQTSKDWALVRDLPLATEEEIAESIRQTVEGADDIRLRLIESARTEPETESLVAGLSLPGFLSLRRIVQTVRGLRQAVEDRVEQKVVKKALERDQERQIGFTGRRMWVSPSGTEGRYGLLHGKVVEAGENFSIPARTVRGRQLAAQPNIPFPRYDPTAVADWSNNRDYVLMEFVGGDGVSVFK